MNFDNLLKTAEKAGIASRKREHACVKSGGHYRDATTVSDGKPGIKCRCGFSAVASAPIWKSDAAKHVCFEFDGVRIYGDPNMGEKTRNALVEMINAAIKYQIERSLLTVLPIPISLVSKEEVK